MYFFLYTCYQFNHFDCALWTCDQYLNIILIHLLKESKITTQEMIEKDCDWFWTNIFSYLLVTFFLSPEMAIIIHEHNDNTLPSVHVLLLCSRPLFSPDFELKRFHYFLRIVWQNYLLVRISEYIQINIVPKVFSTKFRTRKQLIATQWKVPRVFLMR